MRNFTPQGELKIAGLSTEGAAQSGSLGNLLGAGTIHSLAADDDSIAAAQPLSVTADADGLALDQAPVNGVALTLESAATAMVPPRLITLTSSADLSAIDFDVVGFGEGGIAQNETITGPNNETVASTLIYTSITSITPNGSDAANVSAGWPNSTDPFALTQILTALDPPRHITLSSDDDLSGIDFALTGLDAEGVAASETIAGPNNNTVSGTQRFSQILSIEPSVLATGTVSAGWPDEAEWLYDAEVLVEISHLFLRNTSSTPQVIDLTLRLNDAEIPWRRLELEEGESASVLADEEPLPIPASSALLATATTANAVSYSIHGTEEEDS